MKTLDQLAAFALLTAAWLGLAGCGGIAKPPIITGNQPVHGKVLDADGNPVDGGTVTFAGSSGPGTTVTGEIGKDGTFTMETHSATSKEPGVIAAATPYTVLLKLADGMTSYHLKQKFQVKEGDNDFQIKLTRDAYYP